MAMTHLIVFVFILSVTYVVCVTENNDDLLNNYFETINEGSPSEVKILAALSILKTEMRAMDKRLLDNLEAINGKLDASEKNIPAKFDDLENKLNILGKKNKDLDEAREEILHEKLHKQEKKILEKLEEYIDDKLDSSEKHIYRKIDALDKFIADKTDVNVINHKLDALKNKDGTLTNETLRIVNEEVHKKINNIEKYDMSETENNITYIKLDALDKKITNLEDNLKTQLQKIPNMEENIKRKIDIIEQKTIQHFENNINLKLDTMEKNIYTLKNNISCDWGDAMNNTFTQLINQTLYEIQKNNLVIEQKIEKDEDKNNTLASKDSKNKNEIPKTCIPASCKNRSVSGFDYQPIRLDDETFNFVTLKTNADGIEHFEMRFAVKGVKTAILQLLSEPKPGNDDYFLIRMESYFALRLGKPTASDSSSLDHTKIMGATYSFAVSLLPTTYTALNIKITNRVMEISQEPNGTTIVKYTDDRFKSVKYIGFTSWENSIATFLYDCPLHFEDTLL